MGRGFKGSGMGWGFRGSGLVSFRDYNINALFGGGNLVLQMKPVVCAFLGRNGVFSLQKSTDLCWWCSRRAATGQYMVLVWVKILVYYLRRRLFVLELKVLSSVTATNP